VHTESVVLRREELLVWLLVGLNSDTIKNVRTELIICLKLTANDNRMLVHVVRNFKCKKHTIAFSCVALLDVFEDNSGVIV
jgi:hypothetical protein